MPSASRAYACKNQTGRAGVSSFSPENRSAVAVRRLTRAEWQEILGDRPYEPACAPSCPWGLQASFERGPRGTQEPGASFP